jgi:hypothetical protein
MMSHHRFLPPSSFPAGNTHRIVHFEPDRTPSDFERLEEILAEAYVNMRELLLEFGKLPTAHYTDLYDYAASLLDHYDARRLLSDRCSRDLVEFIGDVRKTQEKHGEHAVVSNVLALAEGACGRVQHVADLLDAEKEIGRRRGIQA